MFSEARSPPAGEPAEVITVALPPRDTIWDGPEGPLTLARPPNGDAPWQWRAVPPGRF
jgi:hypothetical protein